MDTGSGRAGKVSENGGESPFRGRPGVRFYLEDSPSGAAFVNFSEGVLEQGEEALKEAGW